MAFWDSNVLNAIAALSRTVVSGFSAVNKRLDAIIVSQASIDNAVTTFGNLLTDITTQNQEILTDLTEIQTLIASGQPVATDALDAVVAKVSAVQTGLDGAVGNLNTLANPPAATPPAGA